MVSQLQTFHKAFLSTDFKFIKDLAPSQHFPQLNVFPVKELVTCASSAFPAVIICNTLVRYEMASLKHPFEAKDEKGLAQKVMTGIYRPVADTYSRDMHDAIKVGL